MLQSPRPFLNLAYGEEGYSIVILLISVVDKAYTLIMMSHIWSTNCKVMVDNLKQDASLLKVHTYLYYIHKTIIFLRKYG